MHITENDLQESVRKNLNMDNLGSVKDRSRDWSEIKKPPNNVYFCDFIKIYLKYNSMNKSGPIILIEDDEDDRNFLKDVFRELNFVNEVIFFEDGESALIYLLNEMIEPFIIISDINMPKLSGMALKEKIQNNENLRLKCIPYLFFTTSANQKDVIDAYSKSVQGFFVKPNSFEKLKTIIKKMVEYWQECESPNFIK